MEIKTKYHGTVDVKSPDIWTFRNGIPGFAEEKEFVLLLLSDNEVYSIMQSINTPELAFVITNPFLFLKDYEFKLDDPSIDQLDIKTEKELAVYTIVNVKDPFERSTVNLLAPLILNTINKRAKQMVLHETNYSTRQPLFPKEANQKKG